MRVSHRFCAAFDDDNLIGAAGLVPVMALAESAGLSDLVAERVTVAGSAGANAQVKVAALVAGMVAGADSISDMDLLRHGGMGRAFVEHRAPTTLGTHLRGFRFGHVRQLDAVASRLLAGLAQRVPGLVGGADRVVYLDIDDTIRETHGYAKQGTGYGYSGVKGLNALVATLSTPLAAPVIAGMRLRKGSVKSARGAGKMIAEALATARRAGAGGLVTVRADSAFYQHDVVAAARRAGACFSITARMDEAVTAAISRIPQKAWVGIKYPEAIWDQDQGRWISDAEVAEIDYTAFTSRKKADHVTARLIVRRVKRLNPATPTGQDELFTAYRHHAVFTDSPLAMLQAEAIHRDHAIVEQVIADLKNRPLAHCPSGVFTANSAWAVLAAIAFNLTRAAGVLASKFHARARAATIRAQLIAVPARIANRARTWTLHLPRNWPWQQAWELLFDTVSGQPPTRLDQRPPPRREGTARGKAGQTGTSPTPSIKTDQQLLPESPHNALQKTDRRIEAEPRRARVFWSKTVMTAGASAFLALASLVVCSAVVVGILSAYDSSSYLTSFAVTSRLGGTAVALVLWGLIGVGIGVLICNTVVAIVGVLVFTQFVEPLIRVALLSSSFPEISGYLPGGAGDALSGGTVVAAALGGSGQGQVAGGLILAAYAVALLGAGLNRMRSTDVL